MNDVDVDDDGIEYDDATHTYTMGGVVVPSVTQILVLGGLEYEPTAVMRDAYYLAGLAGKYVHEACHIFDTGRTFKAPLDPYLVPKFESWKLAREREVISVEASELMVGHALYGFAGRLDKLVTMERWGHGHVRAIVDVKQSWDIPQDVGVQLAGYDLAYSGGDAPSGLHRCVVHLKPRAPKNGGEPEPAYTVKWYDDADDYQAFLGALAIAKWKRKRNIALPEVIER